MEEQGSQPSGSYGGKTVGAFSGGIYIYLCNLLPAEGQLRELAVYAAPCVAVWGKQWGGIALYEVKLAIIQKIQHVKLNRLKAKIDSMPDVPGVQELKKEVSDKFYKVSAGLVHAALDDIAKMTSTSPYSSKEVDKKNK
ncbi:hypothetical protein [Pseudomonas botevensis]|uniref:hypothetical protein n=1 Tax=Pseudomonas botevensis TaxID=2842352 RepID=UPI001C3D2C18|nr:hypothetical protein [Pseudomonas botevensis]MBV4475376.1 hypothetical protein [Pseudomonas botevensis]